MSTRCLRALVIDDDETMLALLGRYLERSFPGIEVTRYPALARGRPGAGFDWTRFDVLLLDHDLGNGERGVDWLKLFRRSSGFPPTVLVTAVGDPYVVAEAVRSGADSDLNKSDLSAARLADTIRDVLGGPPVQTLPSDQLPATDTVGANAIALQFERERSADADRPIDSYRFGRCIGRGATAHIYIAERIRDGANVVIKVLDRALADDELLVRRFIQEAEVIADIDSPYVVKVLEHGFTRSYCFIAMEFFGRGDLKQRIEHGINPEEAILYLYNIALGLAAIHARGVIHRDLKPANIMFRGNGDLVIADFGIAKDLESAHDLTMTGEIIGTPSYMSPEQARGEDAGPQSDLYAAGALLHEMLTGQRPFRGPTISAVMFQHVHAPVPELEDDLARYNPLLKRLMHKDPAQRYRTALDLAADLRAMPEISGP